MSFSTVGGVPSQERRDNKRKAEEGKVPSKERRDNKRKAKEASDGPLYPELVATNKHYIQHVKDGMLVECDVCEKWRLVKEYQEASEVPEFFECSMWNLVDGEPGNCYIPQIQDERDYTNELYTPGSLVWVSNKRNSWWPAMVEDDPYEKEYCWDLETDPEYHVVYFGKLPKRAWVKESKIKPISSLSLHKWQPRPGIRYAIAEAAEALKMNKKDRLIPNSFNTRMEKMRNERREQRRRIKQQKLNQQANQGTCIDNDLCDLKAEQDRQPLGNSEEQVPVVTSIGNQENSQPSGGSGKVLQNKVASSSSGMDNQLPNKETERIDENNNHPHRQEVNIGNSCKPVFETKRLPDFQSTVAANTTVTPNDDDTPSPEMIAYAKWLNKTYKPLFGLRYSIVY